MPTYKLKDLVAEVISGEWGEELSEGSKGTKIIRTTNFSNVGKVDLNKEVVSRDIPLEKVEKKRLLVGDTIIEKSGGSPDQPVGRVVYFEEDDIYLCNNFTYVNAPETKEAERTKVQEGDLLLSITADLGRTAVVDKETAEKGGYINQHLALIRLNEGLNSIYLAHFMKSQSVKIQLEKMNQNGVKAGLNFDSIKKLEILVPDMIEQEKFVSTLKKIEKHKVKFEASLMEMNNLYNSLLQKAFKGELF